MNRRTLLTIGAIGGAGALGLAAGTDHPPLSSDPISSPAGDATWPQPRFDARNTGYSPHATPGYERPTRDWAVSFGYAGHPVVGSHIVLPTGDGLRALDVYGDEAWRADVDFTRDAPVVDGDGTVYYLSHDQFAGYRMDTGDEVWRAAQFQYANTGAPTLAEGRLYLPYHGVSALDGAGRITWNTKYSGARPNPAVDDGTVYVSGFPQVVALDATALSLEWPWEDRDEDSPISTPLEEAVRWRHGPPEGTLPDKRPWLSPALSDERAFVPFWEGDSDSPSELRAVARDDGSEQWIHRTEARDGPELTDWRLTPPVVTDDAVLIGSDDGTVYSLGHDGDVLWRESVSGVPRYLVAGGSRAVVGVNRGNGAPSTLVGLDLSTGERRWTIEHGDELAGLVLAGGRMYAVVYAERDTEGKVMEMQLLAYS